MTCMSMYKTTKIVLVKVGRLIDFLVLCPLVLKAASYAFSDVKGALEPRKVEQCFSIRFNIIRRVTSESHQRVNSGGKKVLPSMYTINRSTGQMHTICSFQAPLLLQSSTSLAMPNLVQLAAFFVHFVLYSQSEILDCSMAETESSKDELYLKSGSFFQSTVKKKK